MRYASLPTLRSIVFIHIFVWDELSRIALYFSAYCETARCTIVLRLVLAEGRREEVFSIQYISSSFCMSFFSVSFYAIRDGIFAVVVAYVQCSLFNLAFAFHSSLNVSSIFRVFLQSFVSFCVRSILPSRATMSRESHLPSGVNNQLTKNHRNSKATRHSSSFEYSIHSVSPDIELNTTKHL